MLLALTAALVIVVQDRTPLRAAPRAQATELARLWQGEVLEVRDERGGYLKVYDYRLERGGYLRSDSTRPLGLSAADAPGLLAVVRFLRDSAGSESLGISYGAAYLRAAPAAALTAEPFDAIARMAERLAEAASARGLSHPDIAQHIQVAEQVGVRMHAFDRNGRLQVCYDGELFRRVLTLRGSSEEQRARAALALTRAECIDPDTGARLRASLDAERGALLDRIDERSLEPLMRSRLHARRAVVWAARAYDDARGGASALPAAQRALAEILAVHPEELGEERRGEYLDALVRVGAMRWAAVNPASQAEPLAIATESGQPGQTCVALTDVHRPAVPLVRRCTYAIVWQASARVIARGHALVLAVQPLEAWRELWVFQQSRDGWRIDVLPPGTEEPGEGYVEFAGFAPATQRLLVVREVKEHGRFRRRFEELALDDLIPVREASSPELLADFGRWQDAAWRRDTLALR
jgi:hypothetical protein